MALMLVDEAVMKQALHAMENVHRLTTTEWHQTIHTLRIMLERHAQEVQDQDYRDRLFNHMVQGIDREFGPG